MSLRKVIWRLEGSRVLWAELEREETKTDVVLRRFQLWYPHLETH